jgi:hypothetical protein
MGWIGARAVEGLVKGGRERERERERVLLISF